MSVHLVINYAIQRGRRRQVQKIWCKGRKERTEKKVELSQIPSFFWTSNVCHKLWLTVQRYLEDLLLMNNFIFYLWWTRGHIVSLTGIKLSCCSCFGRKTSISGSCNSFFYTKLNYWRLLLYMFFVSMTLYQGKHFKLLSIAKIASYYIKSKGYPDLCVV